MSKKRLIALITIGVVLAGALSLISCKKFKRPVTNVTVMLDWTPNTNHTGLYVALEKGYYEQLGLNVKIIQPGAGYTDQVVATGKSEFGVSYQENVTRARTEGLPLVSIAAVIQHNTSGFAALKSAGIKSPKDFEGKRYGSWDSPSELAVLKAIMEKSGADFKKVKVVSGITDFFSTIGRDADFEWIYEGWDGVEAKLRKMDLDYIALKDLEPALDYYLIKTNPELIKKFMKATSQGYEYAIQHPAEAADVLLKHAPELKPELVKASQLYLSDKYQGEAIQWGLQKWETWQNFAGWMVTQKLIPPQVDVSAAFTNNFLPMPDK
jgi:ABC-type nitrate/sulfonate/bicarbonate transport system substrate-binding protein